MNQNLINKLNDAIKQTLAWSESGWNITFGQRHTKVATLKEAESLPNSFVNKLEAVSFWHNVKDTGEQVASYGKKALMALETGNIKEAVDYLYAASYLEKNYELYTQIWRPIYEDMIKLSPN